ncbi:MAG: Single-stranded DNA-binding protein ssb [Candidatus Omnitrophica bacterium ADurb.Bin277]|nr:MAG: Single-stranded DNA-binding protein ssb [Candidatus Omnitrophica bacterium ADurb.Bin277]
MAASLNKVMLIGNLTRDPELRYLPSGQAVTTFTIACNRTYMAKTGEKKEEVSFIRIVVWARRAEVCNEYLKKGSSVFVEGRLQSRSWDAPDGSKRSAVEVIADNVQFLSRGGAGKSAESSEVPTMDVDDSIFEAPEGSGAVKKNGPSVSKDELKPDEDIPF